MLLITKETPIHSAIANTINYTFDEKSDDFYDIESENINA